MKLDERGKQCPLPVIETKKALEKSAAGAVIEVLVDNEIAVQNLTKMAEYKGLMHKEEKLAEQEFLVCITAGAGICRYTSGTGGSYWSIGHGTGR